MKPTLSLVLDNPEFRLEKNDNFGLRYTLSLEKGETYADVELSSTALNALVLQSEALLPRPEIRLTDSEAEHTWRNSAWILKQLSDRDWQLLLRECQCDSVLYLLWYLKDRELARTVMRNYSLRAAAMLTEGLVSRFSGQDPDLASNEMRREGRDQLMATIALVHRLNDEGQIVLNLRPPLYVVNAGSSDALADGEPS